MSHIPPMKVTDTLKNVRETSVLGGIREFTVCVECLNDIESKTNRFFKIEVLETEPHNHCNRCGAITADEYAKRYS